MFATNSAYSMDNLTPAGLSSRSGINLKAVLSTDSIPSHYTIMLTNGFNKVGFTWSPVGFSVFTAYQDLSNPAIPLWSGTSRNVAICAPYSEVHITLHVKGTVAYAAARYAGAITVANGHLYTGTPVTYETGWRTSIDSTSVGLPCSTILKDYGITADALDAGTYGHPYVVRVGKKLVGIGGHGD